MQDVRHALRVPNPEAGWPFWWRWVLLINLGWFPGILAGTFVADRLTSVPPVVGAAIAAVVPAVAFGGAQSLALRSALASPMSWWVATVVGWSSGVIIARWLLEGVLDASPTGVTGAAAVALIAGGVLGVPQAFLLRPFLRHWAWWPAVSAIGWGVLFPGVVPGFVLVRWWWSRPD